MTAAELLGQLLLQDGKSGGDDDGVSLKDGVSRDRMMSVHAGDAPRAQEQQPAL